MILGCFMFISKYFMHIRVKKDLKLYRTTKKWDNCGDDYWLPPARYEEEFEDTKWVIRIRDSRKDRHHHGQMKKDKMTNNDIQNIHIKLKIEFTNPTKILGWNQVFRKAKQLDSDKQFFYLLQYAYSFLKSTNNIIWLFLDVNSVCTDSNALKWQYSPFQQTMTNIESYLIFFFNLWENNYKS
jgi:hypothetical protein